MANLRLNLVPMAISLLGLLLASKRRKKLSSQQLHRMDFTSSARKLGIYFPETLRDRLRHRWLRLK